MEVHRRHRRYLKVLYPVFAVACLTWLVLRSGRKPSRLAYPCQRAALANSAWLLPAAGIGLSRFLRGGRARLLVTLPLLVALTAFLAVGVGGEVPAGAGPVDVTAARVRAAALAPAVWRGAASNGKSDVFVVTHVPPAQPGGARHSGVDALVALLEENGVHLYRTAAAPDGLIATDDVVLVKVNAAWPERGMTNTDVVKGIVAAVLAHPDGFTGEVVLVENCEGGPDFTQTDNNAEDTSQDYQAVVNSFGDYSRVSTSSWWSFTDNVVGEYDEGDAREGYVVLPNNVIYPKFSTGRGTRVSLRRGIWNGGGYDKGRLKLINVPVLKSHNFAGVTGCAKNYMGVQSTHLAADIHNDLIYRGLMGRLMSETIYPCLNILDAIWVSPSHPRGPEGPYSLAARTDTLLAGLDPVSVDYYAGKYVLFPVSGYGRHDPDTPFSEDTNPYHDGSQNTGFPYNAFRMMLDSTAAELQRGGHEVTSDPTRFSVFARDLGGGGGRTGGHCVTGVSEPSTAWHFAEGTTREGFDEFLCLENPREEAVAATITFVTAEGEVTTRDVTLEPLSRKTVHVNEVLGAGKDVSCSVTAGAPIVAERPVYFTYQDGITGGHCVVGAREPGTQWYFAEGYTGEGFDEWVCVLNPGSEAAGLTFRFQTQEAGEVTRSGLVVGPHSRATFKVNDLLGEGFQSSLALSSDHPVVAERPMYFDYRGRGAGGWDGGHCVMGAQALADECLLAEGTTRPGFEEWLTIQNPGAAPLDVRATYLLGPGQGEPVTRTYTVGAGRRHTVFVPDEVGWDKDVSVRLTSASEFLAERPVYFRFQDEGTGEGWTGGHCVIGVMGVYPECYFAEGYTGEGFDEFLCLENPGGTETLVRVDYYTQEEGPLEPRTLAVPAASRVTVRVNDNAGPGYQLSCRLKVLSGPGIVAERPMYFDFR